MVYYCWHDDIEQTWNFSDGHQRYIDLDGFQFSGALLEALENCEEATDVYFWGMNSFLYDLLLLFRERGFVPVDGNAKIKKMHENEFKYLIRDDFYPYTITIKKHNTSFRIINADNILRKPDIKALKRILAFAGQKRKPFTISAIARKVWADFGTNDSFYLSRILPSACKQSFVCGDTKETLETYCRRAYHGGFLCDNSEELKIYDDVTVWDINSLYPYVMKNCPMPYGLPHYEEGEPSEKLLKDVANENLFVFIRFKAKFRIKKDGIPCIRLPYKDQQILFHGRDYLTRSNIKNPYNGKYEKKDELIEFTMTYSDFLLFQQNYDIRKIEYVSHIWFSATKSLFAEYVDNFYELKRRSKDPAERQTYKSLLNNLSGNMARYPEYNNVSINFTDDEEEPFRYIFTNAEGDKSTVYVGASITAWARYIIINLIKKNKDRWIYTDTDSLHLKGSEPPKGVKVGDKLGFVKLEHHYNGAFYYKKKMYAGWDILTNKTHLVFAGMSEYSNLWLSYLLDLKHEGKEDLITEDMILTDEQAEAMNELFEMRPEDFADGQEYAEYKNIAEYNSRWNRDQWNELVLKRMIKNTKTYGEVLKKLYYTPVPLYQNQSDGEFNFRRTRSWAKIVDEYNFL